MLHPLLHHMQANQQGQGVVAVSPRYAPRQVDWQSRWLLDAGCWLAAGFPRCAECRFDKHRAHQSISCPLGRHISPRLTRPSPISPPPSLQVP